MLFGFFVSKCLIDLLLFLKVVFEKLYVMAILLDSLARLLSYILHLNSQYYKRVQTDIASFKEIKGYHINNKFGDFTQTIIHHRP